MEIVPLQSEMGSKMLPDMATKGEVGYELRSMSETGKRWESSEEVLEVLEAGAITCWVGEQPKVRTTGAKVILLFSLNER